MLALFRYEPCQIRKNQLMNNFRGKEAEHVTQKAYDRIVHIDTHLPQFPRIEIARINTGIGHHCDNLEMPDCDG